MRSDKAWCVTIIPIHPKTIQDSWDQGSPTPTLANHVSMDLPFSHRGTDMLEHDWAL